MIFSFTNLIVIVCETGYAFYNKHQIARIFCVAYKNKGPISRDKSKPAYSMKVQIFRAFRRNFWYIRYVEYFKLLCENLNRWILKPCTWCLKSHVFLLKNIPCKIWRFLHAEFFGMECGYKINHGITVQITLCGLNIHQ